MSAFSGAWFSIRKHTCTFGRINFISCTRSHRSYHWWLAPLTKCWQLTKLTTGTFVKQTQKKIPTQDVNEKYELALAFPVIFEWLYTYRLRRIVSLSVPEFDALAGRFIAGCLRFHAVYSRSRDVLTPDVECLQFKRTVRTNQWEESRLCVNQCLATSNR
jgi:hypothetical protein